MKRAFSGLVVAVTSLLGAGFGSVSFATPPSPQPASAADCQRQPQIDDVVALAERTNLYFGELHGSAEMPALFGCVIDAIVGPTGRKVIVSLEIPPSARHANARFWRGRDGRSSVAMFTLVQQLQRLEEQGAIELHFQDRDVGTLIAREPVHRAEELEQLATRGRVVALSGNFHVRRTMIPEISDQRPVGYFLSHQFALIHIVAQQGGTSWMCSDRCDIIEVAPVIPPRGLGLHRLTASEIAEFGFDYVLAIHEVSASPPAG